MSGNYFTSYQSCILSNSYLSVSLAQQDIQVGMAEHQSPRCLQDLTLLQHFSRPQI